MVVVVPVLVLVDPSVQKPQLRSHSPARGHEAQNRAEHRSEPLAHHSAGRRSLQPEASLE